MTSKFKIGDVVEGTQNDRWVRGTIVGFQNGNGRPAINVIETQGGE